MPASPTGYGERNSEEILANPKSEIRNPKSDPHLVPKLCLGTLWGETPLRVPLWTRSRASRTGVPKQSLGTRDLILIRVHPWLFLLLRALHFLEHRLDPLRVLV